MHKKQLAPPDTSYGYEIHDLSIRGILWGVGIFFAFAVAMGIAGFIFLGFFGANTVPEDPYASRQIPPDPNPLLQNDTTAKTDIWNLRNRENTGLGTYGDSTEEGKARIPIEEAIDIAAAEHDGGRVDDLTVPQPNTAEPGPDVDMPDRSPAPAGGGAMPQ